jgi:serine/threonine protein kinase
MPPEQWRGETVTPASDQYALAVVLYEVVTGRLPFETNSAFALMNKHFNEMPTSLTVLRPDVPTTVGVVLERALAKDPQTRYPTVQDFAAEFEQAASGTEGQSTGLFTFELPRKVSLSQRVTTSFTEVERSMPTTQENMEELVAIQKAVEKRLKDRQGVVIHLFIYLTINAILWMQWGNNGWPLLVAFVWGIGLALHAVNIFYETNPGSKWHRREMERELTQRGYDPALANRTVFIPSESSLEGKNNEFSRRFGAGEMQNAKTE